MMIEFIVELYLKFSCAWFDARYCNHSGRQIPIVYAWKISRPSIEAIWKKKKQIFFIVYYNIEKKKQTNL